jgi:hypothetical protein
MFTAIAALGVLVTGPSVGPTPAQSPAELYQLPLYPGGVGPKAALVRDLDGDGRVEVVVPFRSWSGVRGIRVMRGQSDGSLGDPAMYPTDAWPDFIESADLDHDGLLDLVAVCYKSWGHGGVAVLLGRGAGTFHQALEFDIDGDPSAVALGDLDEDGNIDAVVNDDNYYSTHRARLLLGHGDGTFATPIELPLVDRLFAPKLADVNGDGHLDLVAVAEAFGPASVDWFLQTQPGAGDGTLASPNRVLLPVNSDQLAMFDFDGDGRSDAVTSSTYTAFMVPGFVQLYPALPSGTFGTATTLWTGFSAGRSALADIDGDGHMDIAIPHPQLLTGGGGISLARGLGGFAFEPTEEIRTGGSAIACYGGDIEGDGDVDFITLNEEAPDAVGVVRANSPGEFDTGLAPIALPPNSGGLTTGDLDGDGRVDLAMGIGGDQIALRRNLGQGRFGNARILTASTTLSHIALRDFNGDGRADVVAVGPGWVGPTGEPGTLSVWRSTSQGFAARDDYDIAGAYQWIAVADLDDDNHDDLAVLSGPSVQVFHARADGTFEPAANVSLAPYDVGPSRLFAGDFDGDGQIDLASSQLDAVVIAFGLGGGAFAAPVTISLFGDDGNGWLIGAGDLDNDGVDDLVASGNSYGSGIDETALLFGRTNREFEHRRLTEQYNFMQILIGDFDGDGTPDLAGVALDSLVVLTGDGRRGFRHQLSYSTGRYGGPAVADFNGDGRLDFAFTFAQENVLSVMLHR